jgi:hypothetical protein
MPASGKLANFAPKKVLSEDFWRRHMRRVHQSVHFIVTDCHESRNAGVVQPRARVLVLSRIDMRSAVAGLY